MPMIRKSVKIVNLNKFVLSKSEDGQNQQARGSKLQRKSFKIRLREAQEISKALKAFSARQYFSLAPEQLMGQDRECIY